MSILFTQYVLPHGRAKPVNIDRPREVECKARKISKEGLRFKCEILSNDQVSLTITDKERGDLAIQVAHNGTEVGSAIDKLVMSFDLEAHTQSAKDA